MTREDITVSDLQGELSTGDNTNPLFTEFDPIGMRRALLIEPPEGKTNQSFTLTAVDKDTKLLSDQVGFAMSEEGPYTDVGEIPIIAFDGAVEVWVIRLGNDPVLLVGTYDGFEDLTEPTAIEGGGGVVVGGGGELTTVKPIDGNTGVVTGGGGDVAVAGAAPVITGGAGVVTGAVANITVVKPVWGSGGAVAGGGGSVSVNQLPAMAGVWYVRSNQTLSQTTGNDSIVTSTTYPDASIDVGINGATGTSLGMASGIGVTTLAGSFVTSTKATDIVIRIRDLGSGAYTTLTFPIPTGYSLPAGKTVAFELKCEGWDDGYGEDVGFALQTGYMSLHSKITVS